MSILEIDQPVSLAPACPCESSRAARLAGDTIASVWECDDCGHHRPFTRDDFAFANASRWLAPAKRAFAFAR